MSRRDVETRTMFICESEVTKNDRIIDSSRTFLGSLARVTAERIGLTRESLQKGKDQYGRPPCTNYLSSIAIEFENIFLLFNNTTYFN